MDKVARPLTRAVRCYASSSSPSLGLVGKRGVTTPTLPWQCRPCRNGTRCMEPTSLFIARVNPLKPQVPPLRTFATSRKSASSSRASVKDPEPQTGLYYHPTQISVSHGGSGQADETVEGWALSFLPQLSSSDDSVIAYLLPASNAGSSTSPSPDQSPISDPSEYVRSNPDRIRINKPGWKIMHQVLKSEVVPNDELLKFEAETRQSGWAHLTDLRHPLMPGRIATPENIIASVAFVDGVLDPESYEINDSYRLVTGYEGPIQMADSWIQKLRAKFQSM